MSQPIDEVTVAVIPDFKAFAAELKSGIDSALRQVSSEVTSALSGVERQVGEVGRQIGTSFAHGGQQAENALHEISVEATQAFNKVEREATQAANGISSHMGAAFSLVRTGLLTLATGVVTGLATVTAFGLKSAAALEQTQISFNSLLGSVDAGQKAFKQLQDFAAATPFEFKDVAGAAARFFAFSGSVGLAKDQVTGFLTTIGSVASVTGGGAQALNSVTLAMGQIASAGKVTLDNLNQISEALPGFSGVAAIASATGKTTAQVMDEISSGSLDATTGIQALLKGMQTFPGAAGAMEAQAHTLLGVFSTFKDTTSQALVAGFAPVIPQIKESLGQLTPLLGTAIGQIAPALGTLVAGFLPILGQLIGALTSIVGPLLDGLGDGLKSIAGTSVLKVLGDSLGSVATALKPLFPVLAIIITTLGNALIPVINALAPVIADLAPPIVDLLMAFIPLVPVLGELTAALVMVLEPLIKAVAAFVSWLSITGLLPLITLLAQGIGFLASAIAEFGKFLQQIDWDAVGNAIGGAFADAWNAVVAFFAGIGDFFEKLPGRIGDALAALPGLLVSLATQAFDAFFFAIGFGIGVIIEGIRELPTRVGQIFSDLWTAAKNIFIFGVQNLIFIVTQLVPTFLAYIDDLWEQTKKKFKDGVEGAVAFVKSIPGRVRTYLEQLVSQFTGAGGNMIDGLIHGLEHAVGRAVDAVKRAMGDIVAGAKRALGIASPSLVFATEVGEWIPPGIAKGVQDSMPDLHAMLAGATSGLAVPGAGAPGPTVAGGGSSLFAPGAIIINFNGAVPTPAQAQQVGAAVGGGIADTMTKRGIVTAARTV